MPHTNIREIVTRFVATTWFACPLSAISGCQKVIAATASFGQPTRGTRCGWSRSSMSAPQNSLFGPFAWKSTDYGKHGLCPFSGFAMHGVITNSQLRRLSIYTGKPVQLVPDASLCRRYASARFKLPNNMWERLKLRVQTFLKGNNSNRKWKFDDLLALFSWIFVGNAFLILAGTTTFVSVVLWLANSLQFQGLYGIRSYLVLGLF